MRPVVLDRGCFRVALHSTTCGRRALIFYLSLVFTVINRERYSSSTHEGCRAIVILSFKQLSFLQLFYLADSQEDKRKSVGPETTQSVKGGISGTERDIHRVENRLQQVRTRGTQTGFVSVGTHLYTNVRSENRR